MINGGHLHIVQITDFDNVPTKIYDYWVGLRGVSGRNHIGRALIINSFEKNGFLKIAENSFFLHVEHTWGSFFEKNQVKNGKQQEVKRFFFTLDRSVYQKHQMLVDENGLSYIRRLSLFLFKNKEED